VSERLHPAVRLAPAKVNLTLAVVGRRTDGFHSLHSVMVPVGLHDRLSVAPAAGEDDTLHVVGADTGPLAENLVLRGIAQARRAVAATHGPAVATPPLAARLEKQIPVAAGLGGGSSDGAAAIEAALETWGTDLPGPVRLATAAALGSDVPFFLAEGPALVQGRGEQLQLLPNLTGVPAGVLLVTPGLQISTAEAFRAFDAGGSAAPADPASTRQSSQHLADELRTGLTADQLAARAGALAVANDLAPAAFHLAPALLPFRRALSRMLGRPVGLSGSGPTLWALYPSVEAAREAASAVEGSILRHDLEAPGAGRPFVFATDLGGAAR
jgi:4-diphosphocytidyl-2-C-methyl-D-erythritol kinase